MKRDRYPKFERSPDGVPLCRGCKSPVPKGRQTWCSNKCYQENCPTFVKHAVFERDKGVCAICGINTQQLRATARFSNWTDSADAWTEKKNRREELYKLGWPRISRKWWEADHIIPFSEGGPHTLENMRTLCVPCHKKRTAEWRKSLIRRRASATAREAA